MTSSVKTKKCSLRLVTYEIRNILGNPFTSFFGIVFPILMLLIITNAFKGDVPESMRPYANTSVFITISLIIPMAVVLLGYSANYSQELEHEIPIRMRLFGFPERSIMLAKIIAQIIAMTAGLAFYTAVSYAALDLEIPKVSSAVCLIICIYILAVLFFLLGHGLSNILKKFGPTYAVVMFFYFGAMILCGMMGIKTEELPEILQKIASLLPMNYISSDFVGFWKEGSYNFGPIIQSYLFFGAVCGIILIYSIYKNKRVVR